MLDAVNHQLDRHQVLPHRDFASHLEACFYHVSLCHGAAAHVHQAWWETCESLKFTHAILADAWSEATYVWSAMPLCLSSLALVVSLT